MATQGLISVVKNRKVVMKIVAGCDGYNAEKLAQEIKESWPISAQKAYDLAVQHNFGCIDDLVVLLKSKFIFEGDRDLSPLYRKTFNKPKFNPRWKCGIAAHTVVIKV